MEYTYVLPIGDWSKDGHSQSENITMEMNKSKEEIIDAYHKTTELLNMTFDSNDMIGSNPIRLINSWDDNKINKEVADILSQHGVGLELFDNFLGNYYFDAEEAAILFMEFVKISLPDLEYKRVNDKIPYLFGYWGDLNISVGYGVFG